MTKFVTRLVIIGVILGTIAIIGVGLLQPGERKLPAAQGVKQGSGNVGTAIGQNAPNFTLTTLEGKKVSLSDYRGKSVMLNFWAVNCEGCRAELPGMVKLFKDQQAAQKDFVILGVNSLDSATDTSVFTQERHVTFPILLDQTREINGLYGVNGTPTSFFIDRKGIIRASTIGPIDENALQDKIAQLETL